MILNALIRKIHFILYICNAQSQIDKYDTQRLLDSL